MYKYEYKTLHDLLALAEKEKTTLSDIVVRHEVESSEELEAKSTGHHGQPSRCVPGIHRCRHEGPGEIGQRPRRRRCP